MKATTKITRLMALVATLAATLTASAQVPHVGVWTTIDPTDGSRAFIAVNAAWQIVFYDSNATFGCAAEGAGPFLGFDENNGYTVRIVDDVMIGYIDGACHNGGKNQNTSFDFAMRWFPETRVIRSRNTDWDRTMIDPEQFVAYALEMQKTSTDGWEFMSTTSNINYDDSTMVDWSSATGNEAYFNFNFLPPKPPIIAGSDCNGLPFIDPEHSDLRACNLRFAELIAADPLVYHNDLNLREADLLGGELAAFIENSDLKGVRLENATLRGRWRNVNLRFANLRFVKFAAYFSVGFTMEDVDLRGADLRGATWESGSLRTEWRNVNFTRANLSGADLSQFVIRDALFGNTICPDGSNSNDNGGICHL